MQLLQTYDKKDLKKNSCQDCEISLVTEIMKSSLWKFKTIDEYAECDMKMLD